MTRQPGRCQRETVWREAQAHTALLLGCSPAAPGRCRHRWSLPREAGCTQNFPPQQFLNHEEEQSPLDLLPSLLAGWSSSFFANTVSPAAASTLSRQLSHNSWFRLPPMQGPTGLRVGCREGPPLDGSQEAINRCMLSSIPLRAATGSQC